MKRRVEVTIGQPESIEERDAVTTGVPHPDECFYINFVEAGAEEGFTAQCGCLCALKGGTQTWLNGGTPQEVQMAMANTEGHDHDEGEDNEGEEWKK